MGARIEIQDVPEQTQFLRVAPLVGARIEIHNTVDNRPVLRVAPLVGARIEIVFVPVKIAIVTRRSPRGSED